MKITVTKLSRGNYKAAALGLDFTAPSRKLAREGLTAKITQIIESHWVQTIRWDSKGNLYILSYRNGWGYDVVTPGELQGPRTYVGESHYEALEAMERALAGGGGVSGGE